ncbi:MAG TPA: IclR family transcriptional regulator [Alphaproteobacteria bacterium]
MDTKRGGRSAGAPAERQGIQSVEFGAQLLRALAEAPAALGLKEVAGRAGMSASKAHRYLVSLIRVGLVQQDAMTGRYDLGTLALTVGLAALGRLDPVKVGRWAAAAFRTRVDETVLIAVWGNRGPTVVGWEESSKPVTVNVRVGSVIPLLSSATGRVFLAHAPAEHTRALVEAELADLRARRPDDLDALAPDRLVAEVRRYGLGRVDGDLLPGISALAAPIFDHAGRLSLVLTALGHHGVFDSRWDGVVATTLKEIAAAASRRLGAGVAADTAA